MHRTWAGARVFDAPAQPADLRIEQERATFISVFTDDSNVTLDGHSLSGGAAQVDLVIEVAVADQQSVVPDEGDRDPSDPDADRPPALPSTVKLAQTDEGLEATIGFVSAQVAQALIAGNNPWAELWRLMTPQRESVQIRRGGPLQEGREEPAVRFASRVMRMRLHVIADPVWGEPIEPGSFWELFLAMAEADPEMEALGKIVRAHIEYPGEPIPLWRLEQAKMMVSEKAIVRMGIAPAVGEDALAPDETEAPEADRGDSRDIETEAVTTVERDEDEQWPEEVEGGPPPLPDPIEPAPQPSKWEQEGQP
jgi:hypothetical protein